MVDIYLVTGFLGAGKTTLVKNLARLLAPARLSLLINEFGKVGVDGALLYELGASMREISNGSVFCVCRLDQFEKALRELLDHPSDALIVEASGLSDPTSIRTVLNREEFSAYRYRGAICLIDAVNFHKVYATSVACEKQLSVADLILINKADKVSPERLAELTRELTARYPDAEVHPTQFGAMERQWLACLGKNRAGIEAAHDRDLTTQRCAIALHPDPPLARLREMLESLVGQTYRLKGFAASGGRIYAVDCVGSDISIAEWRGMQPEAIDTLVALAGRGMALRRAVRRAAQDYSDIVASVEL